VADAENLTRPDPSPLGLSESVPSIEILKLKFVGIISLGGSTGPAPPPSSSAPDEQPKTNNRKKDKILKKILLSIFKNKLKKNLNKINYSGFFRLKQNYSLFVIVQNHALLS
jgi:hypothetical protein